MIPGPNDFMSLLMAAPGVSDDQLGQLGIETLEDFGSGVRGLLVPARSLAAYRALAREELTTGFWTEMVGRREIHFVFKLRDGTIRELGYGAETRDEIARLCSELNGDPVEDTSDLPRYLAKNPFYREVAVRFHGAPVP